MSNVIKMSNIKAPEAESINDAIVVLESMLRDFQKKDKNSNAANKIAASIVGKSMNISSELFDGILNAQDEERHMNMSALRLAIESLKSLPAEEREKKI